MVRALVLATVVLLGGVAEARPADRCNDLAPMSWARLPKRLQQKFADGQFYNHTTVAWPKMRVTVYIGRAPHLAPDIVRACGGVIAIDAAKAVDARRFSTQLTLHVSSFAALTRIVQLPAVQYVSVVNPNAKPPIQFLDDLQ